jgi:hypothetical protein
MVLTIMNYIYDQQSIRWPLKNGRNPQQH